jgi:hypothetical protein
VDIQPLEKPSDSIPPLEKPEEEHDTTMKIRPRQDLENPPPLKQEGTNNATMSTSSSTSASASASASATTSSTSEEAIKKNEASVVKKKRKLSPENKVVPKTESTKKVKVDRSIYRGNFNFALVDSSNEKSVLDSLHNKEVAIDFVFFSPEVDSDVPVLLPPEEFGLLRSPGQFAMSWNTKKMAWKEYVVRKNYEGFEFSVKDEHGEHKQCVYLVPPEVLLESLVHLKTKSHFLVIQKKEVDKKNNNFIIPITQTSTYCVYGSSKISWFGGADGFGKVSTSNDPKENQMEKEWEKRRDLLHISYQEKKLVKQKNDSLSVGSGTSRKSTAKTRRAAIPVCRE